MTDETTPRQPEASVGETMRDRRLIWTENGLYLDAESIEALRKHSNGRRPIGVSMYGTPVYLVPTVRRPRWWVRAWRKLVRR